MKNAIDCIFALGAAGVCVLVPNAMALLKAAGLW